ncbi:MAG: hypothetical protein AAGA48_35595 [Myxococcota bacterium]
MRHPLDFPPFIEGEAEDGRGSIRDEPFPLEEPILPLDQSLCNALELYGWDLGFNVFVALGKLRIPIDNQFLSIKMEVRI